jgi:GntR family transcriptional repressor for pyruvate dehydrogenase complex
MSFAGYYLTINKTDGPNPRDCPTEHPERRRNSSLASRGSVDANADEKRHLKGRQMTEQIDVGFRPSETVPVYRSVANTIGERILSGEWPIGSGLPSETALAQTLGVNRSTMREAIRVLEENGMLRRRPGGKRLFVSAPSDTEVATRMKAAMVLQEMSFLELWEAMHCIEPAITAAAALRISDAELDVLEENVDRTRHAAAHSQDLVALDLEFHTIIAGASRTHLLQLCREPIGQLFYPSFLRLVLRLNVVERLVFAHEQILDGLRTHDAIKARLWMAKHVVDFRRGYELANLDVTQPFTLAANWAADD